MNVIVIPARYQSSRLPGKVLLELDGKSVIQRVYERCKSSNRVDSIFIAVDHPKTYEHCIKFCPNVIYTSIHHSSGTDRIAHVIEGGIEAKNILNVQGDEPFIPINLLDGIFDRLEEGNEMVSAFTETKKEEEISSPNVVKVVVNKLQDAIYFSRFPIPFVRDPLDMQEFGGTFKHIGVYGYKRDVLLQFAKTPSCSLEKAEKLEQLRALHEGIKINMVYSPEDSFGIDSEEDYFNAIELIHSK